MSHKPRTGPLTLMGALACICAPALAAAPSIHIGVSPSLGNVMVDLVGTFQSYWYDKGIYYDVAVTTDTNENLKTAVAGGGGLWNQYDLVLMDDSDVIADLTKNYASYVQGPPFVFARDQIDHLHHVAAAQLVMRRQLERVDIVDPHQAVAGRRQMVAEHSAALRMEEQAAVGLGEASGFRRKTAGGAARLLDLARPEHVAGGAALHERVPERGNALCRGPHRTAEPRLSEIMGGADPDRSAARSWRSVRRSRQQTRRLELGLDADWGTRHKR